MSALSALRRYFVHLAYLDDSDTRSKTLKWQVLSGVIVEDKKFKVIEIAMCAIQELLVPSEKLDEFKEFHAAELYGGYNSFEGIEQEKRFEAIRKLLELIEQADLTIVYGAVDLKKLQNEVYASANPIDICFRICAKGIQSWVQDELDTRMGDNLTETPTEEQARRLVNSWLETFVILVADECDRKVKEAIQESFRSLRPPRKPPTHIKQSYPFMMTCISGIRDIQSAFSSPTYVVTS